MTKTLILTLGKPLKCVPSGDSVLILRDGIVTETRPILQEAAS